MAERVLGQQSSSCKVLVVEKTQPTTFLQWDVKEAAVGSVARSCRVKLELRLNVLLDTPSQLRTQPCLPR